MWWHEHLVFSMREKVTTHALIACFKTVNSWRTNLLDLFVYFDVMFD